ncbi:MAG TPA: hypothetical protein VFJ74_04595 [Gemmatimonadaceae bacterium]|nr:hypothetical protein [Gemmatimonadaceae bacterium]
MTSSAPSLHARLGVALAVALAAVGVAALFATLHRDTFHGDVDQLWIGARAVLGGHNPYAVIGPRGEYAQGFRLLYPLTAALALVPLSGLSMLAARLAFVGLVSGALAFAVTKDGWQRMPLFISGSFIMAVTAAQWEPLLTAAALVPWLGWSFAAKPNIGLAIFAYRPDWRAVVGSVLLLAVSLAVQPSWPGDWRTALGTAHHFVPIVRHLGGPILLLALLRWKRAEARLLVVMACVPQTTVVYAALPLFLVAETLGENVLLALLTSAALAAQLFIGAHSGSSDTDLTAWAAYVYRVGDALLWIVFVPCLVMVLRRKNEGEVPAWLARVSAVVGERAARARRASA